MTTVRVAERGHVDVDAAVWRELVTSPVFWRLVDRKIVAVSQPGPGAARRIEAGPYVGHADCDGLLLEVVEKVPGSLGALLAFASDGAFRIEHLPSPTSAIGDLVQLLVRSFLEELRAYVARGRDFEYRTSSEVGSLIGGQIDVRRTIGLRARGLRHLAAFDRTELSRATSKNRVLAATLIEIERIARVVSIDAQDLARTRAMAMHFEDCRDVETVFGRRDDIVALAERIRIDPRAQHERDLLALAALLLAHESFEHANSLQRTAPRTWFLNLENLFEAAVRRTLDHPDVSATLRVQAAGQHPPTLFTNDDRTANPDLVVLDGDAVLAVGDVKYKEWRRDADAADPYQLLVHTAAFGACTTFLIYPGEVFDSIELGNSVTGARTHLFCVGFNQLQADLKRVMQELHLVTVT